MGFEPTTPAFERAKTVHALDRAATVIGTPNIITVIKSTGMKRGGSVTRMGEVRKAFKIVISKFKGRRSLERYRC
jgi:formate-dependent phosphoribosylglycinamide formyltransferase (GAR transformylase)